MKKYIFGIYRVEQKDFDRLVSIMTKPDPIRAAELMASKITDRAKIIRRLRAAVMRYGILMTRTAEGLGVVKAFTKRAKELGFTDAEIKHFGFTGFDAADYGFLQLKDRFDADGNVILSSFWLA